MMSLSQTAGMELATLILIVGSFGMLALALVLHRKGRGSDAPAKPRE